MATSREVLAGTSGARRSRARQAGFTLIELMVTMAVIAILAVVAVPAMASLVNGNRLAGATGELAASLQLARSEAIRRSRPMTLCRSTDGVNCANGTDWTSWIVIDPGVAAGDANRVVRNDTAPDSVQVSGPANGIVFRPSGLIDSGQALNVCVPTTSPQQNQRVITVMISGAVVTTRADGGGACP